MSEAKDPAIKLFGKTIPVAEVTVGGGGGGGSLEASSSIAVEVEEEEEDNNNNITININNNNNNNDNNTTNDMDVDHERAKSVANCSSSSIEGNTDKDGEEVQKGDNHNKEIIGDKATDTKDEDGAQPVSSEEQKNSDATSGISGNAKTPSVEKESPTPKASKTEEQSETSNSQEKTSEASNLQEKILKKPDKILPCPRCNSMDTKFCYYNNYNVNQPRHFCKNCQRYWTAGGTMRNVPVGAGRRKNKNSASHYRHINVSEALQNSRSDVPTIVHAHHPSLKSNGTVLTFGSDAPLCESMASVLNLADKTMPNCTQNGFHKPEELRIPVPYGGGEKGDNSANGFSVTTSNLKDEAGKSGSQEQIIQNCQSFPPQMPCFPGAPWPYPWNSAQWSPPVPLPAFCPPGFPMPFYPAAAYWGCSVPGPWNIPWIPQPSPPNLRSPSSSPNFQTLGKHSRDENLLKSNSSVEVEPPKESNSERCLWIPKTLRIDDPSEAAKSSIWATLGIKNVQADLITGGGLFKAFQTKDNESNHVAENSKVLQANPAAMSRSLSFQESS